MSFELRATSIELCAAPERFSKPNELKAQSSQLKALITSRGFTVSDATFSAKPFTVNLTAGCEELTWA